MSGIKSDILCFEGDHSSHKLKPNIYNLNYIVSSLFFYIFNGCFYRRLVGTDISTVLGHTFLQRGLFEMTMCNYFDFNCLCLFFLGSLT